MLLTVDLDLKLFLFLVLASIQKLIISPLPRLAILLLLIVHNEVILYSVFNFFIMRRGH